MRLSLGYDNKSIQVDVEKQDIPNQLTSVPHSEKRQQEILPQITEEDKSYRPYTQRDLFYKIISVFEYDSANPQYCEIFNLDDGRGYTAGIVGFTSEYDDFYLLLEEYSRIKKDNQLQKYLKILKKEDYKMSDLRDLPRDWKKECQDNQFIVAQNRIADQLYYNPAMSHSNVLGITSEVGKLILFDTIIQHGNANDPDGLPSIIKQANNKLGGSPAGGINEKTWLTTFLNIRKSILLNPSNSETQEVWSESVDRCDFYKSLVNSTDDDIILPLYVKTVNHNIIIK